ncbi:MAG: 50S ribosomal protein L22 [Actinobacteria bacterium]|nr:50S ribosomal protein L22 [Actinomycetota bacterium]MBV9665237.1 50S ribosomal protein L22 [Actinomycetota bacterium]
MTGPKTNERPGTRAVLRHAWVSAPKVRVVLDLIRGLEVQRAREVLKFCERDAATLVGKLLDSAVANAEKNDNLLGDELYVSACYADEGRTNKRWRPRARGRATRIRKRSSHITVIVSRMEPERLNRARARQAAEASARRARRVAGGRRASEATQAEAREGSRRRRRGAAAQAAEEVAEAAEAEGIVDVDAEAVAQADEVAEEMAEEAAVEEAPAIEAEDIVDTDAAGVEAAQASTALEAAEAAAAEQAPADEAPAEEATTEEEGDQ